MGIFGKPTETRPNGATPKPAPAPAPPAPSAASARPCVIGPKTTIKGEVLGEEDVVVQGTVEGQIRVARELRVETGGKVRAAVQADTLVVAGEVVGDCTAKARIEIQGTGRLTGDIRAAKIVIAEGAMFRGRSEMGPTGDRKDKAAS